jgi:dTMP kinase
MSPFIAIEGIDGSGTTTVTEWLRAELVDRGVDVHATREPSELPIGRILRQVLAGTMRDDTGQPVRFDDQVVALLFAADRIDHLVHEIEPALKRGAWVLSDRYLLSSLAYQGALCGREWVQGINERARAPDLTLLLDVPIEVAASRRATRGGDAERFDGDAVQRSVAAEYRTLANFVDNVLVVDARQAIADVTADCLKQIFDLLNIRGGKS